jgi:KipI family sensor histidine kinase inhibitor
MSAPTVPKPRILPCGDQGLLLELDDLEAVLGLHEQLTSDPPLGMVDCVPAARTLLVTVDTRVISPQAVARRLAARPAAGRSSRPAGRRARRPVEIPVTYDGPDLEAVAAAAGMAAGEVVALHSGRTYHAAFCGYAPGFAYLTGLDERLRLPRRATPRTRVPPGSVAIAGEFTAVYPRVSPGGWHLLGRTDLPMWQSDRNPPNLLDPGDSVRFVPARNS